MCSRRTGTAGNSIAQRPPASMVVDALGEGVADISVGDRVVGNADFMGSTSAGASDFAILDYWARLPPNVDFVQAAALPMTVETAFRHLDVLRGSAGQTILIHGSGSMIGRQAFVPELDRRSARGGIRSFHCANRPSGTMVKIVSDAASPLTPYEHAQQPTDRAPHPQFHRGR